MVVIVCNYLEPLEHQWYVGSGKHRIKDPNTVSSVQADGEELDYILFYSEGLPRVNCSNVGADMKLSKVQTWYGDHAKWIVANLLR